MTQVYIWSWSQITVHCTAKSGCIGIKGGGGVCVLTEALGPHDQNRALEEVSRATKRSGAVPPRYNALHLRPFNNCRSACGLSVARMRFSSASRRQVPLALFLKGHRMPFRAMRSAVRGCGGSTWLAPSGQAGPCNVPSLSWGRGASPTKVYTSKGEVVKATRPMSPVRNWDFFCLVAVHGCCAIRVMWKLKVPLNLNFRKKKSPLGLYMVLEQLHISRGHPLCANLVGFGIFPEGPFKFSCDAPKYCSLGRKQVSKRSTHARPGMHMQQCPAVP